MLSRLAALGHGLAALSLFGCTAREATAQPKPNPSDWPVAPNAAAQGPFGVVQAATLDRDQLLASWAKPSPGVRLKVTTRAHLGQTLTTFITFRGCQPNASGNCHLTARYEVRSPSGKLVAHPVLAVWSNKPHPHDGVISLGETTLDMTFKPTRLR